MDDIPIMLIDEAKTSNCQLRLRLFDTPGYAA